MQSFDIYITFRGEQIKGYVQKYEPFYIVNINHEMVLMSFGSEFKFLLPNFDFVPGHQRDKTAKDLPSLIAAIKKQLK